MRLQRLGVLAGLALLGVAWLFATPPFASPDEAAHYLRAATLADGHLLGPRVGLDPAGRIAIAQGSWHATEERWIEHDRRAVFIAPAKSPPGQPCANGAPDGGRGCDEVSYTGDYLPTAYLLPAVAFSATDHWQPALWWMRAGSLLLALVFLGLAVMFCARRGPWALLGLAGAVTPMTLCISSVLNPSGLEICASLAFLAGLLDLRRDVQAFSRWSWVALAVAGVVAALAWEVGPLFVAIDCVVVSVLAGRSALRLLARRRARGAWVCGGVLLVAVVLFFVWGRASGMLHSSLHLTPIGANLRAGRLQFTETIRGAIGTFGEYNLPLPGAMTVLWVLVAVGMLAWAVWVGQVRERIALGLALAAAVAFPVFSYGFSQQYTGFGLQGRYVIPVLVLVPMVAGDVIAVARRRVASDWVARALFVGVGIFQLVAWWVNAHHWVGDDNLLAAHPGWRPPAGWAAWLAVACAGAACLAASALGARRPGPGPGWTRR
jgi:hypothetical protein